jgi:hypothetical protein|nr:MAG TPA: hypothetical protein [Caudoviricetes sp.]
MAEKIVFGADIDNVTIKNIDGKLTAVVNVEDAEDEFEVVNDYVEPQEDDDYYVESVFAKFRHKATQLMTDAFKKEKKPRSAPVNESLTAPLTAVTHEERGVITIGVEGSAISQVDGKSLAYSDYNPANTYVEVNKSDYANAKAFNTANAGKTFTVTTAKRYAESEGHPVVKSTEIQVAYPTLKYTEGTGKAELGHDAYYVNAELSSSRTTGTFPSEFYTSAELLDEFRRAVSELDASAITMHYELVTTEGQTFTGDAPIDQTSLTNYNVISVDRSTISDYTSHTFKSEKWTLAPITVESFNFKLVISFEPYVDGNA